MGRKKKSTIEVYGQPECALPKSFFEGRFIPDFHQESLDYEQWWDEQVNRCLYGFKDGGYAATPAYYYHLNFKKINMLDERGSILIFHPYFSDEDQQLFLEVDEAKRDGQGIIIGTGRGFGKSYDISSIVEHGFTFHEGHESIISASIEKYVNELQQKIELGLNSQPDQIRLGLLEDTKLRKLSGYKIKVNGQEKKEGLFSSIKKIIYDADPDKTRGTRPSIHVFEEGGSWATGKASLKQCYKKTEPSWWRGKFYTSLPIIIGTGGSMDNGGSEDFKEMFNHPRSYNLKSFEWDGERIGKFIPAYRKFSGYYERSGKSDEKGAKVFLDGRRESKMEDPELYRQETMEFPFNPKEMFQVSGTGWMPAALLEKRYADIERTPELKAMVQRGDLDFVYAGSRITGVTWTANPKGIFEIVEHPIWTRSNWSGAHPKGLYVSGCDSFDAVEEEGSQDSKKSPGCIYIWKRFWRVSETSRFFVARLKQRTDDAKEFYWNCIKLLLYYSGEYPCKMLGEYTKIGIFRHFIENHFEWLLYPRPKLDTVETGVKKTTSTNRYGVTMPGPIKRYVIKNYADTLKEPGIMELMYFLQLILDNLAFSFEGYDKNRHDDTMAAAITLLADGDMFNVAVKVAEVQAINWPVFRTNAKGVIVFD